MQQHIVALVLATSFLIACDDPIVGRWERRDLVAGCTERPEFEVLDDLSGRGDYCSCDFDFTVENRGDDVYRFDVDLQPVCLLADGKYDCDLVRDDTELRCGNLGEFELIGD